MVIGRDDELRAIGAFLAEIEEGPCALVLSGEPGIGKTVLWERGVGEARGHGRRVLVHRSVEAETSLSFTGLSDLLAPVFDDVAPLPYERMQSSQDENLANGKYYYVKNGFLNQLPDDGIDRAIDVFQRAPGEFILFFDPTDGAYHQVAPDATAFPNRGALYWLGLVAVWSTPDGADAKIARIRSAWKELAPLATGFYANLADADEPLAAYRENYGGNLERLMSLKARYDPMNLFRLNANVPPKA